MQVVGTAGQKNGAQYLFDASTSIVSASVSQLVLLKSSQRSTLFLQNLSSNAMYVEFGPARATCAISSGAVNAVSVANAGFGYSLPPKVIFFGGAYLNTNQITPTYSIAGLPDFASPGNTAQAHCVMGGSAPNQTVSSIVIDNPGSGYAYPPFVYLLNDPNDPYGAAAPSTTSGVLLPANGATPYKADASFCTTDQVSVYSSTSGGALVCKYSL